MYLATLGRRKSASINIVLCPANDRAMARFNAVVVLPSLGDAEVTAIIFGGDSGLMNCRFVRSVRNDSTRTA